MSAYIWNIPVCGVTYSLVVMSANQFCRVLYPRRLLYKKKKWVLICCGIQCNLAILMPIPLISLSPETCDTLLTRSLADIYLLAVVVVIPCCAMIIIHLIIFIHAWSSTRRVAFAVENTAERRGTSHAIFNGREKSLLKHIILMMFVYVIGWLPVYIGKIIFGAVFTTTFLFKILLILPIISCLLNIANILIYHHEFRHYIKQRISLLIKRDERQKNSTIKA